MKPEFYEVLRKYLPPDEYYRITDEADTRIKELEDMLRRCDNDLICLNTYYKDSTQHSDVQKLLNDGVNNMYQGEEGRRAYYGEDSLEVAILKARIKELESLLQDIGYTIVNGELDEHVLLESVTKLLKDRSE
jgi:hypothetical protein